MSLPDDVTSWLKTASPNDVLLATTLGVRMLSGGVLKGVVSSPDVIAVRSGQIGESYVYDVLSKQFNVRMNTKTARAGDMTLYIDDAKLLIEVKNYKGVVPGDQVDKFLRDLSSGLSYGGVFVSLGGPIAGGVEGLRFEQINDSFVPVVYVCCDDERIITNAVHTVYTMITMQKWILRETYNKDGVFRDITELTDQLDTLTRSTSAFYDGIDDINKVLRKNALQLSLCENNMKNTVRSLREHISDARIVTGGDITTTISKGGIVLDTATEDVVREIDKCGETAPVPSWRVLKTKIVHLPTMITVSFAKSGSSILIPDKYFGDEAALAAYKRYPKRVIISSGLSIDITPETHDFIVERFIKPLQHA